MDHADLVHALEECGRAEWAIVRADVREAPLLVLGAARLVAERVRPVRMPPIPGVAFGDDPVPVLRHLAEGVLLEGAYDPRFKLVSADGGTDDYLVALVPDDLDIQAA